MPDEFGCEEISYGWLIVDLLSVGELQRQFLEQEMNRLERKCEGVRTRFRLADLQIIQPA